MMASGGVEVVVLRDCLGGQRIVELMLPRGPGEADIEAMANGGEIQVLRTAARPYYRVDVPGFYLITGILDDPRVRFTVRLSQRERAVELALDAVKVMEAPR